MKKTTIIGLCLSMILSAGSVYALSLGGVTGGKVVSSSTINDVGSSVAVSNLNSKLSQKTSSCKCNVSSKKLEGCNFGDIRKVIKEHEAGVKVAFNRSFRITSRVNRACWDELQSQIPASNGYWSWYYSKYDGSDVSISAEK